VPDELKGEALVVFAVVNGEGSEAVREEISARITGGAGEELKPQKVRFAADLPMTRNAKVLPRLIRPVHLAQALGVPPAWRIRLLWRRSGRPRRVAHPASARL
jgi:acetyl-CoA synthetase